MQTCPYCHLKFETRPNRSNPQNSYLWGVVYKLLSDETGHSPEECHEILKLKFLPSHVLEIGNIKERVAMSTKDLDTVEFNEYIEKITQFAAEQLSIVIPPPRKENDEPDRHNP